MHTPKAKEDNLSIFRRFKQKNKRTEKDKLMFFCSSVKKRKFLCLYNPRLKKSNHMALNLKL